MVSIPFKNHKITEVKDSTRLQLSVVFIHNVLAFTTRLCPWLKPERCVCVDFNAKMTNYLVIL